ncbi:PQQ-dependent sugar dehydrogenase [Dokdonella ginsengisoli]|uniref:PQQ-dependent sugar dehydrogenase n=1 Tax=Dokdonella ginsengisoli TaxID=363846 RepID=A0ABV9QNB1_9GAMM
MQRFAAWPVLVLAFAAGFAPAQGVPPGLTLQTVTDEVAAPIGVRAPNDGSGRLFVISQAGSIRVIRDGVLLPTPFLSVPVTYPGSGGTGGLLGLAFHPNYGKPGLPHADEFYVVSIRPPGCSPPGTCLGTGPDEVLERYVVSAGDADVADPAGTVVMRIPGTNVQFHNGGDIHFGTDGYLYMSSGDGGQEGGTNGFAECLWKKAADGNPASCGSSGGVQYYLRGKMLRIDVDTRGAAATEEMCGAAAGAPAEYAIPPDNPYLGDSQTCDEIWLYGFRNPWRWSFDRATGEMWIGDVGQSQFEEIDRRAPASDEPRFYGWHCLEGTARYNSANVCADPLPPSVPPLLEYDHAGARCAVTGGYRFRGPIPALQGTYVFADSCSSEIFLASADEQDHWSYQRWRDDADGYGTYSGFGEDEAGNLYVADTDAGVVYRFAAPQTTHQVTPGTVGAGSIDPATVQTVNDGEVATFLVQPEPGYVVADVSGCGGALAGDVYTTAPVTQDCAVTATFAVGDRIFAAGFEAAAPTAPAVPSARSH